MKYLKYLVVLVSLGAGCYAIYLHDDVRVAAFLIFLGGLLTDYAELGAFAINAVKTWKAPNA